MGQVAHYPEGISKDDFESIVAGNPEGVVVDVYTVWCGPCKMMAPIFESLAGKFTKYKFISVDLDQTHWMGEKFGITAIPTFLFFKDGKMVHARVGGLYEDAFSDLIKKVFE
ncbi:MAG: thioredoxin [Promethearchaeota archaeon]